MIITKTPYRLSFLGGGTDYPQFFAKHGGSVLSATFDQYAYVSAHPLPRFFPYSNQIVHASVEYTRSAAEIEHPLIRNAMQFAGMEGLQVMLTGDLPGGTGLGGSSAFTVGLLSAFYAMKGETVDPHTLARQAIHVERELAGEDGGWQDQVATVYGGLNRIDFHGDTFAVRPLAISPERKALLNRRLMIFYTGFARKGEIATEQSRVLSDRTAQLQEMLSFVDDGEKILTGQIDSLDEFGRLLDYTWRIKRGMTTRTTNDTIDALYQSALHAGALGGKLMGAGGGGFLLLYVPEDRKPNVQTALQTLKPLEYRFGTKGTEVILAE